MKQIFMHDFIKNNLYNKKVAVKIGQNIHAGFHQKIISINIKVTEQIRHNNHA